jgi:hypothetical protein
MHSANTSQYILMDYASSVELILYFPLTCFKQTHIQVKVRIQCVEIFELLQYCRGGFRIAVNVYAETDISSCEIWGSKGGDSVITIFCNVTPCSLIDVYRSSGLRTVII